MTETGLIRRGEWLLLEGILKCLAIDDLIDYESVGLPLQIRPTPPKGGLSPASLFILIETSAYLMCSERSRNHFKTPRGFDIATEPTSKISQERHREPRSNLPCNRHAYLPAIGLPAHAPVERTQAHDVRMPHTASRNPPKCTEKRK